MKYATIIFLTFISAVLLFVTSIIAWVLNLPTRLFVFIGGFFDQTTKMGSTWIKAHDAAIRARNASNGEQR